MTPLPDKLWFESHQALLLRMVATSYGRDLLLIPQDFKEIVKLEPSSVHGLLESNRVNTKIIARYYTSDRFANTIRYRWVEFSRYAKHFYSHGGETEILLDGGFKLACTTDTFYPEPDPATTNGDGSVRVDSQASWTLARDATTGTPFNSTLTLPIFSDYTTGKDYRVGRLLFNFNTSLSGVTIDSSKFSPYIQSLIDGYGDEVIHIVPASPASANTLVGTDFDNITFASKGSKTVASLTTGTHNDITVTDLSLIDTSGGITSIATIFGRDLDNIAPSTLDTNNFVNVRMSDNAGTALDPYLEVTYTVGLNSTTVGIATAVANGATSIDVSMPYTDDNNSNNTYTVDYKLSEDASYTNFVTGDTNTPSPYTNTITGLLNGRTYDVKMTYIDADGVTGTNPQTVSDILLTWVETGVSIFRRFMTLFSKRHTMEFKTSRRTMTNKSKRNTFEV